MSNILIIISIMLIIISLSSLLYKIKHLGVFIPTIIGFIILIFEFSSKYYKYSFPVIFNIFEVLFLLFYLILFLSILICNFTYPKPQKDDFNNSTLVILGCRIRKDKPSKMLTKRLSKAISILNNNPDLKCIVSGGQGEDEEFSESFIMKKYLSENGISLNRIFEENKSTNTFTNLKYSKKIIYNNNLKENMIILSDSYHLYRSYQYAKKLCISCSCIACKTNPILWFSYMFRELLGLCVYYIKYKR